MQFNAEKTKKASGWVRVRVKVRIRWGRVEFMVFYGSISHDC